LTWIVVVVLRSGVKFSMKVLKLLCLVLVVLLLAAAPAFAQDTPSSLTLSGTGVGAGLGAAFTIVGAGWGFGRIGAAALESMARQPEIAGRIQTAMIVIAALLEGATFFALLVCVIMAFGAKF
jgi:F-type H+-transporting ATPase subunit c